jgi:SNF2 family DNA or RNA helicase
LHDIVEESRASDQKILIFSAFIPVLRAVVETVEKLNIPCFLIYGDIRVSLRPGIIDSFIQSPGTAILVLQIETGGVGLNLQAASVVVLMEPQYKPSTEWQAIDRANRMGQTRRVMVHRLIAEDSLDEHILKITDFKAEQFDQLARYSKLAESSLYAMDNLVNKDDLLAAERSRLNISEPDVGSETD